MFQITEKLEESKLFPAILDTGALDGNYFENSFRK